MKHVKTLAVCATSIFLVGLDTTIVNVALPSIGQDLGLATADLEWAVDAYTLVLAALLISSGALADRIGRRRVFRLGLVLFAIGSVACALAPSIGVLVAARAVQGVGGSMLSPVALAIVVSAITDPRERARAIGVWAAVFGLSMAAGPVLGGLLVTGSGWRLVFWVNLPIIAVVLALTARYVPESRAPKPRRPDLPGQLLLIVLVVATVAVLIEGPRLGWAAPPLLLGYAAVAAAATAFARVEKRRAEPLMDLRLFRRAPFAAAVGGAVAVFAALNVTLLLGTLHLQQVRGLSPVAAGLVTLPLAVAATVCAPLSGRLVGRIGPRLPLRVAGVCTAVSGLLLAAGTSMPVLLVAYLFAGTGVGFANAPITNTAVSGLPPERAGVAGGITSTARQVGAALGVAVAGGVHAAGASRAGWLLVAACGLVVFAAGVVRARGPRQAGPSVLSGDRRGS